MEIRQQLFLISYIVYCGIISGQPLKHIENQAITSKVNDHSKIRENFRNLFNAIGMNDKPKSQVYRTILEQEAAKEHRTFAAMKEEFQNARNRNFYNRRHFNSRSENVVAAKRETSMSKASKSAEKSSEKEDTKENKAVSLKPGNAESQSANQTKSSPTFGDPKAVHTFVEKIQIAIESKNSKVMDSYLQEMKRMRTNLNKIEDDLQDVTFDEAEEVKGLKEFLQYLDKAINHGLKCLKQALNEDRKTDVNATSEATEASRVQFTIEPIDNSIVLQMMDSIKRLKTCLQDQRKRCKRLYSEAKEAIVTAQERLTEAVEAYTDLLQHIDGKAYIKPDTKPEDDDDSRSTN